MERRSINLAVADGFKTRAEDGKLYIEGYFAVFGSPYWLDYEGGSYETIDPAAFDETINGDIRALINHDTTLVLGRTTIGTLRLSIDARGLYGIIEINSKDLDAVNLYERVKRGDVSQCSFGFDIEEFAIEYDEATDTIHRTLVKIKLYEVSVVTFPAYAETGVVARGSDPEYVEKTKLDLWREKMTRRLGKGTV